ncbi:MAG TPA: hypothetical protein VH120_08935, partial [Gemmataceae bacterium]|nr:hypothetical protein [Gemmataceae bacterium]
MSHRTAFTALFFTALAATPAAAQPGGYLDISPGPSYRQGNAPNSETDTFNPQNGFLSPSNQVPQEQFNWWFYRVAGDPVQRPFGTYTKSDGFGISGTSSYPIFPPGGTTATYHWTESGPSGVRFTATYTTTLSGSPLGFDSRLDQSFQVSNPNTAPLTISLFDWVVWTPGNKPFGDSAVGDLNSISVTDGTYQDSL